MEKRIYALLTILFFILFTFIYFKSFNTSAPIGKECHIQPVSYSLFSYYPKHEVCVNVYPDTQHLSETIAVFSLLFCFVFLFAFLVQF